MLKKVIYGTIILFIVIMITVIILAVNTPIKTVKYENGVVIEETE